jgi:hypothetical protein
MRALWKRPYVRQELREGNIKMDFKEMGSEEGKWMQAAQDHFKLLCFVLHVLKFGLQLPKKKLLSADEAN